MIFITLVLLIICTFSGPLFGCTDFLLTAKDKTVVVGRSLEFNTKLGGTLRVTPRAHSKKSTAPGGKSGFAWVDKYGYIGIYTTDADILTDGMNEQGLSFGALWLPGTTYQEVPKGKNDRALLLNDIGEWILGSFTTVEEVKESLASLFVWAEPIAEIGGIPPIHLSIHDAAGKSLVVEYLEGKLHAHFNPVQVLTNAPPFPWQLTNLGNYVNLRALNAAPLKMGSHVLGQIGQGSGMLGIPGDWTPPSRFVRIANFKHFASRPEDSLGAVNLAAHLLNTVDIPYGDVIEDKKSQAIDYTQWVVIKDLTNHRLYYRTYDDLTLRYIDLSHVNLNPEAPPLQLTLPKKTSFEETTNRLVRQEILTRASNR